MMPRSNTPPNGDFVRYVERLTADKLPSDTKAGMLASKQTVMPGETGPATQNFGAMKVGFEPFTQISFLRHVRWVFGLWLAVQLLAWLVPGAGFMWLPLVVLYATWAIFDHRQKALGASSIEPKTPAGRIADFIANVQKSKSNPP